MATATETRGQTVRWVRLRWIYDDESLLLPNLEPPTWVGTHGSKTLWTLHSPSGFQTKRDHGTELRSGLARAAELDLIRAASQAEIVRHLTGEYRQNADNSAVRTELIAAQGRFYQYCRQVEQALAEVPPGEAEEKGADGQTLTDKLTRLLEENREHAKGSVELEKIRAEAEREAEQVRAIRPVPDAFAPNAAGHGEAGRYASAGYARAGAGGTALPERGTGFGGSGEPGAAAPVVRLIPVAVRETQGGRLVGVSWWLGLMVGVWLLTMMPALLRRTRPFWPEQLVLLGAVGWYIAGPRPVVVALLAAWAVVRLIRVGRFSSHLWNGWTASPNVTPSAVALRR